MIITYQKKFRCARKETLIKLVLSGAWDKKTTYIENFKSSNIQNSNEILSLALRIQRLVDSGNKPSKHPSVDCFGQCTHRVHNLEINIIIKSATVTIRKQHWAIITLQQSSIIYINRIFNLKNLKFRN